MGATWNNRSEAVGAELVSGNYFNVLGVQPAAGRVFEAGDETAHGRESGCCPGFRLLETDLAEAPVVGRTLLVDGAPFTVVGVAAPGFQQHDLGKCPTFTCPITMQRTIIPERNYLDDRQHVLARSVAGRLTPGSDRGGRPPRR